jgi:hypothetical protein
MPFILVPTSIYPNTLAHCILPHWSATFFMYLETYTLAFVSFKINRRSVLVGRPSSDSFHLLGLRSHFDCVSLLVSNNDQQSTKLPFRWMIFMEDCTEHIHSRWHLGLGNSRPPKFAYTMAHLRRLHASMELDQAASDSPSMASIFFRWAASTIF